MYFDDEEKDERDPFELFGDAPEAAADPVEELNLAQSAPETVTTIEPQAPRTTRGGFSWAGFMGGMAALVWIAGAIGGPLSYFGLESVMTMDPAMQAGLIALAIGPALLFWLSASAAGEALKARRIAAQIATQGAGFPLEAESSVQRIAGAVKGEIEALNDAVAGAMSRLAELEGAAQRNAALFDSAVAASRENTEIMSQALRSEHEALVELNGDMKGQTEELAHAVGRQVRLMREASKLVRTEITAAEDALEGHMGAFQASAAVLGERTVQIQQAADGAARLTASPSMAR